MRIVVWCHVTELFTSFQVDIIHQLFRQSMDDPPLNKNQPPIAGAIMWERSLFNRMKHTIIRFQTVEDMLASDHGKNVS